MGKGPKVPQSSVDTQVKLQQQELDLMNKYSNLALPGIKSSMDYWQSILKGGPQAQAAVAPYAATINAQGNQASKQIENFMPAGGERNLAAAMVPVSTASNIAHLYAGMQPAAASALGGLSLGAGGAGNQSGGVSSQAGAANENLAGQQAQAKGAALGGLGEGLGSAAGGYLGGKKP